MNINILLFIGTLFYLLFLGIANAKTNNSQSCNCDGLNDQSWYVGGGTGYLPKGFRYTGDKKYYPFAMDSASNMDVSIFGGYNFTNWFALEMEINSGIPNRTYYNDHTEQASSNSIIASTVFTYHINERHALFVKQGFGYAEYLFTNSNPSNTLDWPYNKEMYYNLAFYAGGGYEYAFNKNHALSVSYNYYTTFIHDETIRDGFSYDNSFNKYTLSTIELKIAYKYSFK